MKEPFDWGLAFYYWFITFMTLVIVGMMGWILVNLFIELMASPVLFVIAVGVVALIFASGAIAIFLARRQQKRA